MGNLEARQPQLNIIFMEVNHRKSQTEVLLLINPVRTIVSFTKNETS